MPSAILEIGLAASCGSGYSSAPLHQIPLVNLSVTLIDWAFGLLAE
jgi:hypothetical protein